jgi:uncharacterized membrane protein YfcA
VTADPVAAGLLFLLVAALYASVGQAGASGYLAVMSVLGMEPAPMKVTALSLNLLVAAIGTLQFWRRGLLSLRAFYPFAVLGFPFSLLGGAVQLPAAAYYPAVGAILLLASAQMLRTALRPAGPRPDPPAAPPFLPSLVTGAAIGFVSGTTGTGGGIFLAPVILAMNWVGVRRAAAVTAAYNLLNSAAALAGARAILPSAPAALPGWLLAVTAGGAAGAFLGSRYLPDRALRLILALILAAAGLRLLLA